MIDTYATEIIEGPKKEARLNELGLEEEDLITAVLAAELERRNCSALEPRSAPGFKAWSTGFGVLAETLTQKGWTRVEKQGLPRMVNPENGVAIAVIHGDEATGRRVASPKTKSARGAQSLCLVRSNCQQLNLPFGDERFVPLPPEEEQITWWLMIYSDGASVLRAELSLPVGVGEDSRFSMWQERIGISVPDPGPEFDATRYDDDDALDIEVSVRPKGK